MKAPTSSERNTVEPIVWLKFEAEHNTRDAAYQLIRLRRKLGLPIQIPLHGPGGKRALEEYLIDSKNEQVRSLGLLNEEGKISLISCRLVSTYGKKWNLLLLFTSWSR